MTKTLFKYWLPVVVWAGFIFFLSHQPYLKSDLPVYWDFACRKLAHITEYAVLTWLLIRALSQRSDHQIKIIISAVLLSIGYALSDEYHQSFILGRDSSLIDVGFDSIGIFLIALLTFFHKTKQLKNGKIE